jgi:hypothetical protein
MNRVQFLDQAHECRSRAQAYAGRPEEPFLLSVAIAFEELASAPKPHGKRKDDHE